MLMFRLQHLKVITILMMHEQGGTAYSTAANGPFVAKWAGDLGNTFQSIHLSIR